MGAGRACGGGEEDDCCPGYEPAAKRRKKGACKHGPDDEECNRFRFTSVHKGEWELQLWQDSKLIVCLTNFFSGERAGLLARGSHKSKVSYEVWAPEGVWHYNVEGRSATDGHDQKRKLVCLSERRCQRLGTKKMLWGVDLAITNGSIIEEEIGQAAQLEPKEQAKLTKVNFALGWAQEIFDRTKPMRQRTTPGMCIMQAQALNSSEFCTPSSAHVMARTEHELCDMGVQTRNNGFRTCKKAQGPKKRKRIPNGECCYTGCPGEEGGLAKTSQLFCPSCRADGKGGYYHLGCFHRVHRCCVGA